MDFILQQKSDQVNLIAFSFLPRISGNNNVIFYQCFS